MRNSSEDKMSASYAIRHTLSRLIRNGKAAPVTEFLHENPSQNILCTFDSVVERKVEGKGKSVVESYECIDDNADFSECTVSPLFVAILRVFRNQARDAAAEESLLVLAALLRHGFSATTVQRQMHVCNVGSWNHIQKSNETPASFAMWLNYEVNREPTIAMDTVLQKLKDASQQFGIARPMAQVPASTKQFWGSLLFSETASDVRFQCASTDGPPELVPALKGVLMAASEYFRAQLSGAWQDAHADGIIATALPASIIRALLTFIYCGELDTTLLERQTNALLRASCEFMLEDLKHICEAQLARTLTKDVVREALLTAHLHDCELLKEACYRFLKTHPGVLTQPSFFTLSTGFPDLWRHLTMALGGDPEDEGEAKEEKEEEEEGERKDGEEGVGDKRKR